MHVNKKKIYNYKVKCRNQYALWFWEEKNEMQIFTDIFFVAVETDIEKRLTVNPQTKEIIDCKSKVNNQSKFWTFQLTGFQQYVFVDYFDKHIMELILFWYNTLLKRIDVLIYILLNVVTLKLLFWSLNKPLGF